MCELCLTLNFFWMCQIEESGEATVSRNLDYEEADRPVSPPLHLAAGLGIGVNLVGGSSPVDYTAAVSDMDGNAEEEYMRMIKEYPHHSVLLRNYAQFLSQVNVSYFLH